MAQPRLAELLLADEGLKDQGLLSRMLLAWPPSNIGARTIPGDGRPDHSAQQAILAGFHRRIIELMETGLPEGPPETLRLGRLALSPDARALLVAFHNHVEPLQRRGAAFQSIRGFASKAVEQAARIAGIFQLFEDRAAPEVSGETMAQAIDLMDWYLAEAKRLLEVSAVPEPLCKAEKLRAWLVSHWGEQRVDVRTVVRRGPCAICDAEVARQAIGVLTDFNWLVREQGTHVVDGARSRTCWRVVRP